MHVSLKFGQRQDSRVILANQNRHNAIQSRRLNGACGALGLDNTAAPLVIPARIREDTEVRVKAAWSIAQQMIKTRTGRLNFMKASSDSQV